MRLEEDARSDPASIQRLYVRTRDGGVVELRNLVTVQTGAAPSAISRLDRQRSVTVSGNLEGKKLGAAVAEAREIAAEILPEGVQLGPPPGPGVPEGVADFGVALLLASRDLMVAGSAVRA